MGNRRYHKRKTFTIIEILIALSLFVIVGLGIYRALCAGLSVWEWQSDYRLSSHMSIFFEKIAQDMRNYCAVRDNSFQGKEATIRFTVQENTVRFSREKNDFELSPLYDVEYYFDQKRARITRRLFRFGEQTPFIETTVLENVPQMSFSYYLIEGQENEMKKQSFSPTLAHHVEITLGWYDKNGQLQLTKKVIEIPFARYRLSAAN